ncbi:Profilin-1 [Trichinella pseudospiralis]
MDIKQQLNKRLAEILNEKSENSVIYSRATYDKIVNDLLQIQAKGACSAGDHIFKRRFELLIFGEEHRLIRKRKKMGCPFAYWSLGRKENIFGDKKRNEPTLQWRYAKFT